MKNLILRLFGCTSAIIFILIMWVALINYQSGLIAPVIVPGISNSIMTTTAAIILFAFIIGGFTGVISNSFSQANHNEEIAFYKKKIEKLINNKDAESSQVKTLKNKIASLEIALQNALNNNNKIQ